jgi:hypothetical protein
MKLGLGEENGVCVLTGTGEISDHDVQVLKAGLTKLFSSGKNRIVVHITQATVVPPEMSREIAKLDQVARSRGGRVVVSLPAGLPGLRASVEEAAAPADIEVFDSKEAAVKKLRATEGGLAAVAAAPAKAPPENPQFKADIRQKELTESGDLRKRIEVLEKQNELLIDQLKAALQARRVPPGDVALRSEISALEEKIQQLLTAKQTGGKSS